MKKILLLTNLLLCALITSAQTENGPATENIMESNGKIYVVVGVVLLIFAGIIAYMIAIDRKLTKIEKTLKK